MARENGFRTRRTSLSSDNVGQIAAMSMLLQCGSGCSPSGWWVPDDWAMELNEVLLPGVGLRYEFTTTRGDRVGIVARREGDFELVAYDRRDPDQSRPLLRLSAEEAAAIAEILGAPRVAERFADLTKEVPGLSAGQIEGDPSSRFVGRPLGETRARSRTGASIVAIVRGDEVIASPTPAEALQSGDVLIVIGTLEGIAGVDRIVHP
jgi:TrkA domain protein